MLHGAHVLGEGKTTLGAGVSGTFLSGQAARELVDARSVPLSSGDGSAIPPSEASRESYARGAAAVAALGPAVAPWVAARVGLPHDTEAGLTFTGRLVRVDARYAYQGDRLALSVGAGVSAPLMSQAAGGSQLAGLSFRQTSGTSSYGFDAPVLVGWRSASGIVSAWTGPRFGYERIGAEAQFATESPARVGAISLDRVYYGGVLGMALGFRHLYGAIELDVSRQSFSGEVLGHEVSSNALTLAPAAALIAKF